MAFARGCAVAVAVAAIVGVEIRLGVLAEVESGFQEDVAEAGAPPLAVHHGGIAPVDAVDFFE